MAAMTFAAIKLHREQQVTDAFTKEQERIISEGGNRRRSNYCELMKVYLQKGTLPYTDKEKFHYQDPAGSRTITELFHENAIIRYLYLGKKEEAIRTTERLAMTRLWAIGAPTQVRPMRFFQLPYIHDFLTDEQILMRIREAAYINTGALIRK